MGVCTRRTAEWGSVVSDSEVLVMFVTVDGENPVRKIFRTTKNSIKCEGRGKKTKVELKNRIIIYLREIFTANYKLDTFIYRITQFWLFASYSEHCGLG
jgi:hypothetical protein